MIKENRRRVFRKERRNRKFSATFKKPWSGTGLIGKHGVTGPSADQMWDRRIKALITSNKPDNLYNRIGKVNGSVFHLKRLVETQALYKKITIEAEKL